MERRTLAAAVVLTALSTLVIAGAMLGLIAILSVSADGIADRVPYYLLGGAAVFTGIIIYLERDQEDGATILTVSLAVGVVGTLAIGLAIEGLLFGLREPDRVLSNLFVYLLAAGLLSTGVIFWAVRHWREFARTHEIV